MRRHLSIAAAVFALAAAAGVADAKTYRIQSGPMAGQQLLAAAAAAGEGDEISFGEGRFDLPEGATFKADKLRISGRGPDRTILSFLRQSGSEPALHVIGDRARIEDLSIEEAAGDGLRVSDADRVEIRNVRVAWSGQTERGGDGIEVTESNDVVIERVRVDHAPAGGVTVRRSDRVRVREAAVEQNRVGVLMDSSQSVELREIAAAANATGALLVNAPHGPGRIGAGAVVSRSKFDRSVGGPRGLEGDVASLAPEGVGLAIMGYRDVRIAQNDFAASALAHIMALAYPDSAKDPEFIAIPQDVMITKNTFGLFSPFAPTGVYADLAGMPAQADILWDGAVNWFAGGRPRAGVVRIGFDENEARGGSPSYKTLDLKGAGTPASEAAPAEERQLKLDIPEPRIRQPE